MIVTPIYAGLLAILFFVLSLRVVRLRGHGVVLVVARLLHGYALSFTEKFKFGRFWGTALTFTLVIACGALCLYQGVSATTKLP